MFLVGKQPISDKLNGSDETDSGFTLVEMLVALAVLAIMGALMASFLSQLRTVNRFEAEIAKQTELEAAASYLQRLFTSVRPIKLLNAEPDTNPLFDGQKTSVETAIVTRQGIYSLGLRDVKVFLQESSGKTNLVHTLAPRRVVNGKPVPPAGPPIPIIDDIDTIQFEYSSGSSWSDSFSKDGEIPSAMRITIRATVDKRVLSATAITQIN
ncbi:MAG: prepilin-type N-terminal cleavage/methylation domain-containing protein [Rhizobiaceae bacterium]|nr:prepilin-type N-terminal cleavage/methylation domain-containing protein [Rhizobiaceae bacterium]